MSKIEGYYLKNNMIIDLFIVTDKNRHYHIHLYTNGEYYFMYISEYEIKEALIDILKDINIDFEYFTSEDKLTEKIGIRKSEHDKLLMYLKVIGVEHNDYN